MRLAIALPALVLGLVPGLLAESRLPNIVVIIVDDLGWADVSYHADRCETPNIDRFVNEGLELDRFYVAPMCSPTRAGVMTGRYPIRFGLSKKAREEHADFDNEYLVQWQKQFEEKNGKKKNASNNDEEMVEAFDDFN